MGEYYATVRLKDNNATVRVGQENFTTVSSCQGIGTDGGCPVAHVVAALGS